MMKLVLAALLGAAFTMPAAAQTAPAATAPATAAPAATPAPAEAEDDADDDAPAATPTAAPAAAASVQHHDFGPSGIMVRSNREDLAPLTLASGKPVAEAEYSLKSGGY